MWIDLHSHRRLPVSLKREDSKIMTVEVDDDDDEVGRQARRCVPRAVSNQAIPQGHV
jgi:hypothetical protein